MWNRAVSYITDKKYCRWCHKHKPEEGGIWIVRNTGRNKIWRCASCKLGIESYLKEQAKKLKKEYFGEGTSK